MIIFSLQLPINGPPARELMVAGVIEALGWFVIASGQLSFAML